MRTLLIGIVIFILIGCSSNKSANSNQKPATIHTEESVENQPTENPEPSETQAAQNETWQLYNASDLPDLEKRIEPSNFTLYKCDFLALLKQLDKNEITIDLPMIDQMRSFQLENSNTMSEELAAKFPNIKSYKGKSEDGIYAIRLDTNEEGLFVEISSPQSKQLISPILKGNTTFYALCRSQDLPKTQRDASFH